ncbi:hypothetical protein K6T82_18200 [Flavobacterium sp. 17A]|uniref:Uncharacterized protein n=1 Tax=Flavobacterium potami TaxID=2872310 RepID=A0A9X1HCD7_9FLAO|nr:hypothetical protein [Flavobacterium potami]MBZ4036708.1 hypothetical protein [Flavobacterium potami]
MKNLKAWLLILPFFTMACSDEYAEETIETSYQNKSMKKAGMSPANTANPYDSAGMIHNEILEILADTDFNSTSVEEITVLIDSVSAAHPELMLSTVDSTLSSRVLEITGIINSSDPVSNILGVSSLGTLAKTSFTAFLNSLLLASDSPYSDIHPIIVSYEASVLSSLAFSADEKRIILTASSVARYSVAEKKRKDKDWETSVTNIVAAVSGAQSNTALGLKMAAAVGICQNNNLAP